MAEGHRERMRTRVRENGILSLHPHEMLEFLLFPLIPRKETNALAHRLVKQFGNLDNVFNATEEELLTVSGMTPMSALYLANYQKAVRFAETDARRKVLCLDNLRTVFQYLNSIYRGILDERFVLLALDGSNVLIRDVVLEHGNSDTVEVTLAKIARFAMDSHAKSIIMCHNHIYGNMEPSDSDLRSTWNVETFLKSLSIKLHDSLILAGEDIFSFRLSGALGNDMISQDQLRLHDAKYYFAKYEEIYENILKHIVHNDYPKEIEL